MRDLEKMYAISGRISIKKGDILAGKYRYIKKLGMGGMGAVCLVSDIKTDELLAMKYCLNEDHADRFEREVLAWLQLGRHPNIVSAIYFDKINDKPTLFIEYVKGQTLREIIEKNSKNKQEFYLEMILDYAIQLCRGMDHLHERGVIHRDLNPNNVIIKEDDESFGIIKITDLGLSKLKVVPQKTKTSMSGRQIVAKIELTETNQVLGTPQYMSPQQYTSSKEVNESTDIYSFGLILYEMISCGKFPFEATSTTGWLHAHLYKPPRHIKKQTAIKFSFFNNKSKNDLYELVMECLAKQNEERPSNFAAIEERLVSIYEQFTKKSYRRSKISTIELSKWEELNNKAISLLKIGQEHVKEAKEILEKVCITYPKYTVAQLNLSLLKLKNNELTLADFWLELLELQSKSNDTEKILEIMTGGALEKRTYIEKSLAILCELPNIEKYPNLARKKAKWLFLKGDYENSYRMWKEICSQDHSGGDDYYNYAGALVLKEISNNNAQVVPKVDKFAVSLSTEARQQAWDILREGEKKCGTSEWLEKAKDIVAGGEVPKLSFWHESGNLHGHKKAIEKILITPDGKKIISSEKDCLKVWDAKSLSEVCSFSVESNITSVAITLQGDYTIIGFENGKLQIFNLLDKTSEIVKASKNKIMGVGFYNNDEDFISCDEMGMIKYWKLKDIQKKHFISFLSKKPYKTYDLQEKISCSTIDINGNLIVAGGYQGKVYFLQSENNKNNINIVEGHRNVVKKILISTNGRVALSMSATLPNNLLLWDLKNREKIHFSQENVTSMAITGDAKHLLIATSQGFLEIMNTNKKIKLLSLEAHNAEIKDVAVTADASLAVSGAADGTIKLWHNNYTWPLQLEQNFLKSSGI